MHISVKVLEGSDVVIDSLTRLKRAKFALHAWNPRAALIWARTEINNTDNRISAIALHRAAMASGMLGREASACRLFEQSEKKFRQLRTQDSLGLAMVVRDFEFYKMETCTFAQGSERDNYQNSCLGRMEYATLLLQHIRATERVQGEILVTIGFIHRLQWMIEPGTQRVADDLMNDLAAIRSWRRKTRGKKPMYELDALEWVLYTRKNPLNVIPDGLERRAFILSMQVGNPFLTAKFATAPAINLGTKLFRTTFD